MNIIDKAILAELNQWDLSCSEEPALKIELAKALGRVAKNCYTPDVAERGKQFICRDCEKPSKEYRDQMCEPCYKWHTDS